MVANYLELMLFKLVATVGPLGPGLRPRPTHWHARSRRVLKFDEPAGSDDHVNFRSLRLYVSCNAPVPIYPEGLAFFPPFLEGLTHASSA